MLTAAFARHIADLDPDRYGTFDVPGASIALQDMPVAVDGIGVFVKPGRVEYGVPDGYDYESIQIIVRRDKARGRARSGYEVAKDLRDALHGLRHVDLAPGTEDEVRLIRCLADDNGPTDLGVDANGHRRWSLRFDTQTAHDTDHSIV